MRVGEVGTISQQNCAREAFSVAAFGGCWLENQILYNQQNFTSCVLEVKNLSSEILNDLLPWTKAAAQRVCPLWHKYYDFIKTNVIRIFLLNGFFFLSLLTYDCKVCLPPPPAEGHMVSSSLLEWHKLLQPAVHETHFGGDLSYTQGQKRHYHYNVLINWVWWFLSSGLWTFSCFLQCSAYEWQVLGFVFTFISLWSFSLKVQPSLDAPSLIKVIQKMKFG